MSPLQQMASGFGELNATAAPVLPGPVFHVYFSLNLTSWRTSCVIHEVAVMCFALLIRKNKLGQSKEQSRTLFLYTVMIWNVCYCKCTLPRIDIYGSHQALYQYLGTIHFLWVGGQGRWFLGAIGKFSS